MHDKAILYLIASPIGNLQDISARALNILAQTPLIAAEDTRRTKQLLTAHGITNKKLMPLHAHNENAAAAKLIQQLSTTVKSAAYISDAGTPGISDPGAKLVNAARAANITVSPIPGASALSAILSISGTTATTTHFFGFAPRAAAQRQRFFAALPGFGGNIVLFESPTRILATVTHLCTVFGDSARLICAREMSKLHEQITDLSLAQTAAAIASGDIPPRGEFALLLFSPGQNPLSATAAEMFATLTKELPPRRAAQIVAKFCGGKAGDYYRQHIGGGGGEEI